MPGIKETKEVIIAVNELSMVLIERLKDGAQVEDAVALFTKLSTDMEFQNVLKMAYDGVGQVKGEVDELDASEIAELVVLQAQYVPKILDSLKK